MMKMRHVGSFVDDLEGFFFCLELADKIKKTLCDGFVGELEGGMMGEGLMG